MRALKKMSFKRYFCILISIVLVLTTITSSIIVFGATATFKVGTVNASSLNIRADAGTNYDIIGSVGNGASGAVLGSKKDSSGTTWYQMLLNGYTGWVSSQYITVSNKTSDSAFENQLSKQNFPESYKNLLRYLHLQYPNWVFEAQHTNLDWNTVIKEESALGVNLVSNSSKSSHKSTQSGAYDWTKDEWKVFDSPNWVAASSEIIKYYMDPRTSLDSTYIFQFLKQSYDESSLTTTEKNNIKSSLKTMVSGTFLAGSYTESGKSIAYVDTIMDAAKISGVSPYVLASMIIQEQGADGSGGCISGTVSGYKGYYNFFNVGAYASGSMDAVERGMWYAKGSGTGSTTYNRPWNTRTKSIIGGAQFYADGYVNQGQDTLYLKKFNVQGNNLYEHQYMTNVAGASSEAGHLAGAYNSTARKAALVFKIPVYKNIPSTLCQKPTKDGNPNYMLKSLSVTGYSISPSFDMYDTSYTLKVKNSVSSVTINATKMSSKATVTGTGTKTLKVGSNTFNIVVKAENGNTRTYKITITRDSGSSITPSVPTPSIKSTSYKINSSTITGIKTYPVTASTFKGKFTVTNGSVKVTDSSGKTISDNVGTGDQIRLYDNNSSLNKTYNVIIYGDTNGDGQVNALDLLRIQKSILGVSKLSGNYSTAADTSKDGNINALDLLQVQKQLLKIKYIEQ